MELKNKTEKASFALSVFFICFLPDGLCPFFTAMCRWDGMRAALYFERGCFLGFAVRDAFDWRRFFLTEKPKHPSFFPRAKYSPWQYAVSLARSRHSLPFSSISEL